MNEEKFTKQFVIPFLRKVGFKNIRYVHGQDEYGRDVIFFDRDRFGLPIVCACQVKVGDIKGTQKKKIQNEIVPQLLEGIRTPYKDESTGEMFRIHRIYLLISGILKGTAKEQIYSLTNNHPNIFLMDIQSINYLIGGDGHDTFFMFTRSGSDVSYPVGLKMTPKLPLMQKGMFLGVTIDLGEFGYTDFMEITEVSYEPVLRSQLVTVKLPLGNEVELTPEIRKIAATELENYFKDVGAYLDDIIDELICDESWCENVKAQDKK